MKKTICAILSLIFLASVGLFMDTIPGTANSEENTSEEYVVKQADSLWGISGNKLEDPFLWPRVWNVNPQIKNPDLIHPGTKIIIPSREELLGSPPPLKAMPLALLKQKTLKPLPQLIFEFPEESLNKYIIDKEEFIKSGWIAPEFPGIGKLLFTERGSHLVDHGDLLYLETSGNTEIGATYYAIKSVKKVKHPITGKKMGQQIGISGILEIIESDSDILKARVKSTFDNINVGDGLLPYKEMEPPLMIKNPRTPDISGYIIESRINSTISSPGEIIFLDKGSDDGVEVGDVFKAISEKPARRPIGKLQVIMIQPATSTAVILESIREISIGDPWGQL